MLMDSSFFLTTIAATAIGFFTLFRKFRFHQENKDVGYSSTSTPSGSSSSTSTPSALSCNWTHHVFPSFRGEDVRRNFLSHIQKEFQRKGITPFIDNEIRRGESIGPELIKAIRGSKIAIVLLSRNYASSKWCLDELVEIMNCKKEFGLTVFAIFYEVDPSHVKKLTGEFGSVFEKTCKGRTNEDIWRWRQAFKEVATIAGYDSRNWDNEAAMIEDITTEISKRLISYTPSSDLEGLIGMGAHMEKMKQLLCLESADEKRTVGISGPSGIGKSTVARVLHNQISDCFPLSVFMKFKPSYARPTCSDDFDVKLQLEQQFLSQLTNQKDIKIHHLGTAQNFVIGKKVLIVLDGVDQLVQLLAMPKVVCLGPGSRIIITTQDQKLLEAFQIKHIYSVDFPLDDEALQIFCMNAFGQDSPYGGFEDLATKVTIHAGNLPLGLRVMGSYFRGMSKEDWIGELPRLRIRLDGEIGSILKFSYDALDDEDKDLFLHIACFFDDEGLDHIEDTLRHKFSNVQQGLRVLFQRSLISQETYPPMHNLLVQLGREIVRNQSIYEPGKRQFLVDDREICEVLTDHTGSESVIGINLEDYGNVDELNISERGFEEMSNLQFLRVCHERLQLPQGLYYLPPKLRILHWDYYPMTCLPSKFNPKILVKIILQDSKLEKLWEGIQPQLINLKVMDLGRSRNLKELPYLSTATNLLEMNLNHCSSLIELPSSIGNLINLQKLDLRECSSLVELPSSIGNLINLHKLDLRDCSSLVELPSSIGTLINLKELYLWKCSSLVELPSSIGNLINLHKLDLRDCSSLVELPSSIGTLINLKELYLWKCSRLVELPSSIGNLINLQRLYLRKCSNLNLVELLSSIENLINLQELSLGECSSLVELPSSIGNLINLQILYLSEWSNLVELPSFIGNLINLRRLDLDGCSSLVELPSSIENLINLQNLVLSKCSNLVELPSSIGNLINLRRLDLDGCSSLVELPSSIGNLIKLKELDLSGCSKLLHLPSVVGNFLNFEILKLNGCSSLLELPSSIGNVINLKGLSLNGCSSLVEIPCSIGNLINLQKLDLRECSSLVELPSSIGNVINLKELSLNGCSSLVEIPCSIGNLINLQKLDLRECSSLVELPSSIGNVINLKELSLNGCSSLVEIPCSIGNLINLQKLDLRECSSLVELPSSIGNVINLKELSLNGCSSLVEIPCSIGNLRMLKKLSLQGCSKVEVLPININLDSLEELDVTGCSQLTSFPEISTNIERLMLGGTLIKAVPLSIKSWPRLYDLRITYCKDLEFPHALDLITELELNDTEIEDVPAWVNGISRLRRLVLNKCRKLVSLPQLPSSLEQLDAIYCESLERIACSFPNPVVCLKFIDCWKLNEEGRDIIIQTSTILYAIFPGREVPAFFTYRSTTGGSVAVKLNQRRLPTSFRFKACILLINKGDKSAYKEWVSVVLSIADKQSGRKYKSISQYLNPPLTEHLYTFEGKVKNVKSIELFFKFEVEWGISEWEIGECGIRPLLEEDTYVESSI